jgi:prolyl-tRNA editing enzyme YbaK/EbsC (Cys-tRNA(Pro) deacylase)
VESTPASENPSITSFRAALAQQSPGEHEVRVLPDSVHTAALAAEALGCTVGAIAKSLVFDAEGEPVLILTSGEHHVDTTATAARIGVPALKRAKPEFVREHTGHVIGGVSPIDHPRPVRTYLDVTLQEFDPIWAAAGHPAAVFSTTYADLLAMTGAQEITVD